MEPLGIPTLSFLTEQFKGLGQITAKSRSLPDLPIIVLPHLYDQLPEDDIREDIRRRLPDILAALTATG